MIQWITRTILRGLAIIIPIALTLYLLYWLGHTAESVLGPPLRFGLPHGWYVSGMGLIVGVAAVLLAGLLGQAWLFRKLGGVINRIIERIPFVKTIYGTTRDLMDFVSQSNQKDYNQVVLMKIPGTDVKMLGFVTRQDMAGLPEGFQGDQRVAVYLPMSYQLGGYTVLIGRDHIDPVDMKLDEAMKFAMTAGVKAIHHHPLDHGQSDHATQKG